MQATPFASSNHRLTPYCGGAIAADIPASARLDTWPPAQLLLFDASWRAVLAIAGTEARKWLNGMITTNVRDLEPGQWAPGFQLDPKGHILATLDLVCTGPDAFLLLTDEAQRAALELRLRRFVFVSKLTIEDRSAAWTALRLRGPQAAAVAVSTGWCAPPPEPGRAAACPADAWTLASTPGGVPQLECVAPVAAAVSLWEKLQAHATIADAGVQEQARIFARQPLYGADITEAELPQETGQLDHLSFCKGCYIGQEIVERIRARGAVHRHWSAFRFEGPVPAGAPVEAGGRTAGKLTSITACGDGTLFALGYMRDVAPGAPVAAAGVSGTLLE